MEKPVKYLLIFLLGLAVIFGASSFSFIVHHCFTSEHFDVPSRRGHTENCCHHPDHTIHQEDDSCCQDQTNQEKQKPSAELSHKCCEEDLMAFRGLPLYYKSNIPEISAELLAVNSLFSPVTFFPLEKPGIFRFTVPPPKFSGKQILLLHQVFLL